MASYDLAVKHTEAVHDGERWWWGPKPPGDTDPLVMDSWLVEDGRSRRPERHVARFVAASEAVLHTREVDVVLDEVLARIPRAGRWWPRLEGHHDTVALWLRPVPVALESLTLWVSDTPDRRMWPQVKGPDLMVLREGLAAAQEAGADEALLWRVDGDLPEALESTWCALVWWDGETFVARPLDDASLPSITIECLEVGLAGTQTPLARGRVSVDALLEKPVWAVNAARGIQSVRGWVLPDGETREAATTEDRDALDAMLREALDAVAAPLPESLTP